MAAWALKTFNVYAIDSMDMPVLGLHHQSNTKAARLVLHGTAEPMITAIDHQVYDALKQQVQQLKLEQQHVAAQRSKHKEVCLC